MNPKDSPTASERAEGPADERAAFEVWAHLNLFGLELNAAGSYEHRATRYAWQGWLARSRLAAATPVVPPSKSAMIAILEAQGWQWTPSSGEGGLYRYLPHEGVEFVQVSTLEALAASPSPRTPEQPEQPSVHPVEASASIIGTQTVVEGVRR